MLCVIMSLLFSLPSSKSTLTIFVIHSVVAIINTSKIVDKCIKNFQWNTGSSKYSNFIIVKVWIPLGNFASQIH